MTAGVWQAVDDTAKEQAVAASFVSLLIGVVAVLIPAWVLWRSANLESYSEISEGSGDPEFKKFLERQEYEPLLRRH